jgi:hypothetical protein
VHGASRPRGVGRLPCVVPSLFCVILGHSGSPPAGRAAVRFAGGGSRPHPPHSAGPPRREGPVRHSSRDATDSGADTDSRKAPGTGRTDNEHLSCPARSVLSVPTFSDMLRHLRLGQSDNQIPDGPPARRRAGYLTRARPLHIAGRGKLKAENGRGAGTTGQRSVRRRPIRGHPNRNAVGRRTAPVSFHYTVASGPGLVREPVLQESTDRPTGPA